ncbi:MAG: tRNA pseudouridine(38-40) synthase TruA [Candidatus Omnitrophica bacterium]|jgi:tRNA pseudouridine38-40 synthase|nr:tRNA pseudouridine(38-40) synthase TruA [Candidatus Omnitrophota bacterium]MDD5078859.1 tRNA pseudouridine(38-40) synthase TruA [Candidatus Omnitrophota bacterium]
MRNISLTLQYEGTRYNGWQRQRNTRNTIQEIAEKTLSRILQSKISLIACGRTDAGVHAQQQTVNFKTKNPIPLNNLKKALNSLLPDDIKVSAARIVPADFHSQYSCLSKTYCYTILNRDHPDVFQRGRVYFYPHRLDFAAMRKASRFLAGKHDFSSFKKTEIRGPKTNVRDIRSIRLKKKNGFIYIEITAKGFLYNMVRNIAGTLIEVGRGKIRISDLPGILSAKDRSAAGPTAPACGLCLIKARF